MKGKFIELFGWYGTCAIILAYASISFNYISPTDPTYQLLNLTGALGIVMETLYKKDYQPAVLNIIWAVVGLIALIKMFS
ncbi:MAG: hypothetical protein AAB965_02055 [Patescibacteria group bacterium]